MIPSSQETIIAQATPPGKGGVGIIRISGPKVTEIAAALCKTIPQPRRATVKTFFDENGMAIDQGILLFFPAPNSFTGEDVLELHGHGGPLVLDNLIQRVLSLGARLARPGEFTERAFLNDKIDLTQAEAIADLIDAGSKQAQRAAIRSLQGEFSQQINQLVETLIHLRMYVEAAIDFPEEEVDFLSDGKIEKELNLILEKLLQIKNTAQQGALLREGMTVVIAGKPNAGKSSLLNRLCGRDSAIVTEIPGTTRDILREPINLDGLPLNIIDTAGLRSTVDQVEQEGIRRAWNEINNADQILLVIDAAEIKNNNLLEQIPAEFSHAQEKVTIILNKIDLLEVNHLTEIHANRTMVALSAKTGLGIDLLRNHLKKCAGFNTAEDGIFIARRRHLNALEAAQKFLLNGKSQFETDRAGELLAEELLQAQKALNEITGEFRADDLLGQIFASFCIGK